MSRRKNRESVTNELHEVSGRRASRFRLEPFSPEVEDWDYYIQRFELELRVHGIDDEAEQRDLLLTRVGPAAFKVVVDYFRPAKVEGKSYDSIVEVLNGYYGKTYSAIGERVTFARRMREEGESVAHYLNSLRALAGHCEFGSSLKERLRDQLILGISNSAWQKELIKLHPDAKCSLKDVEATALNLESADAVQRKIESLTVPGPVDSDVRAVRKPSRVEGKTCDWCGYSEHRKGQRCPAEGKDCKECGKIGHFGSVCLSRRRRRVRRVGSSGSESSSSSDARSRVHNVKAGSQVKLDVHLNGRPVSMLFDPGASVSIIDKKCWKKIGRPKLEPAASLVAYAGGTIDVLGRANVMVTAFDKTMDLPVVVIPGKDIPLFGLNWILGFNLPLPPGARVCQVAGVPAQPSQGTEAVLSKFKEVFAPGLGTITGQRLKIHMKEGATPKVFKSRQVPIALRSAVQQELTRLVQEGVLEEVDPTRTPIERTPAEMMFGRTVRTKLTLLKPDVSADIGEAITRQKRDHDKKTGLKSFGVGEEVWVKKRPNEDFVSGTVVKTLGAVMYLVDVDGVHHRRHVDQLRHKG